MQEVLEQQQQQQQKKILFLIDSDQTTLNKNTYQLHYSNIDYKDYKNKNVYSYDPDLDFAGDIEVEKSVIDKKMEQVKKIISQSGAIEISLEDFVSIGKQVAKQHNDNIVSKLSINEALIREKTNAFSEEFGIDSPRQLQFLVSLRKDIANNQEIDLVYLENKNKQVHSIFDGGMLELIVDFCNTVRNEIFPENQEEKKKKNKM